MWTCEHQLIPGNGDNSSYVDMAEMVEIWISYTEDLSLSILAGDEGDDRLMQICY
jgi:hypothetical protein